MENTGRPSGDGAADGGAAGDTRGAPPLAWVLLVLAMCAAVAIATHGLRLVPPPLSLAGPWPWAVRVAGAAAVAAGILLLLRERRVLRRESAGRPDPTVVGLRTAAVIMGVLAVVALTVHPLDVVPMPRGLGPSFSLGRMPRPGGRLGLPGAQSGSMSGNAAMGTGPAELEEGGLNVTVPGADTAAGSPLQRLARSVIPLLLLLVAALAFRTMTRPPTVHFELLLGTPVAREDAAAGLAASLVEIGGDSPDPRHQITAAYHRLLAALAAAGAPRRPQEAPHEYLNRALGPLGVRPQALHGLTDLYVLAQFSERPITERHRAAAAEALDVSLTDLRAGHPFAGAGAGDRSGPRT